jgi:glycosyltransferase involved in cell wall biosynthesis
MQNNQAQSFELPQKNILLYLPWNNYDMLGGVDVVVDRLWERLEHLYPGTAIIGLQDWKTHGDKIDACGRRFLHLNLPSPQMQGDRLWIRYAVSMARRLPKLLFDLRKRQIEIVNMHNPTLNAVPIALLKLSGLWAGRLVLSFHGSDVNNVLSDNPLWKLVAKQTDAITACSSALARRIEDIGLFNKRVNVVYNGIDGDRFLDGQAFTLPSIGGRYLLNVGNYVQLKGQDVLLRAFARIAPQYPDLKVVFVGGVGDGVWLKYLHELADQLHLRDRVVFLQNYPHNKLALLMSNAVCLAHTANEEAFGLVLIEAGVCCLPIIATRVGGVPEIINSPEYGLLFEKRNSEELANAICSVLQQPDKAKARAENFFNRVSIAFSTEAMSEKFFRVLNVI